MTLLLHRQQCTVAVAVVFQYGRLHAHATQGEMQDPVLAADGHSYEREAIDSESCSCGFRTMISLLLKAASYDINASFQMFLSGNALLSAMSCSEREMTVMYASTLHGTVSL